MGKKAKKMKNNIIKKNEIDKEKHNLALKKEMLIALQNEEYDKGLDVVSKLISSGSKDSDVFYSAARIYYMIGDMERAAKWVDNTLRFAPNHIDARLLLAKLCLLDERLDDAMSIYTYILHNFKSGLSMEQLDIIRDDVKMGVIGDEEWIKKEYPLVYDVLCPSNIKNKSENKDNVDDDSINVSNIIDDVASRDVSIKDKILLYNTFAAGLYVENKIDDAERILNEALHLDIHDNMTLKNMAMLQCDKGEIDRALLFASKMSCVDFVLLKLIST